MADLGFGYPYQIDPIELGPGRGWGGGQPATGGLKRMPEPDQPFWQQLLMARAQNPRQRVTNNGAPVGQPYVVNPAYEQYMQDDVSMGGPGGQSAMMNAPQQYMPVQGMQQQSSRGGLIDRLLNRGGGNAGGGGAVGGAPQTGMYAEPVDQNIQGWSGAPRPQALHNYTQMGPQGTAMGTLNSQLAGLGNVQAAPPTNYNPYQTRRQLPAELTAMPYGMLSAFSNPYALLQLGGIIG